MTISSSPNRAYSFVFPLNLEFSKALALFEDIVLKAHRNRIHNPNPFLLRWSQNDWISQKDTPSTATILGIHYVDVAVPKDRPLRYGLRFIGTGPNAGKVEISRLT